MYPRCRRCGAEVSRGADECPECGYAPGAVARDVGGVLLLLGLAATIAFPPLGVLMLFTGVVVVGWSLLASPAG